MEKKMLTIEVQETPRDMMRKMGVLLGGAGRKMIFFFKKFQVVIIKKRRLTLKPRESF